MIKPFETTSIIIDDPNISITKTFDGDMYFRDNFVPGIKLKDLLLASQGGGTIIIDPAIIVLVETLDYTYVSIDDVYAVDIPHNFGFNGSKKSGIIVEVYDSNFTKITVDEIVSKENSTYMRVITPDNLYVCLKRVV